MKTNIPSLSVCSIITALALLVIPLIPSKVAALSVVNQSFEDTTGLGAPFNEFHFGLNPGWDYYDPNNIVSGGNGANGIFTGTLDVAAGSPWFDGNTSPDGDRVAILFGYGNAASAGAGEYGLEQTLADSLQANTEYQLQVEVGNIASGFSDNGSYFPLDGFPGYRVELLAGGVVIAQEDSMAIDEGEFATSVVTFVSGNTHAQLGQSLGIRLINLNNVTAPNDVEVDFDDVRLNASPVPIPAALWLFMSALLLGFPLLKK